MKKTFYMIMALAAATAGFTSCNEEWEDEQFRQLVSLKAEPNSSGVTDTYVRFNAEGEKVYELPVILSGSTMSTQDRVVRIAVDPDTLAQLNIERYGTSERNDAIKYKQLDAQYFHFPETVTIPAGECATTLPITFTLGGENNANPLDMGEKWILPLTVVDGEESYEANPRKHYRKALLNIQPFNDYSGVYGGTQFFISSQFDSNGDGVVDGNDAAAGAASTENEHRAYVYDDQTVFFYGGRINSEDINRNLYKVYVRFSEDGFEGTEDDFRKPLEIWSDNPDNNFKVTSDISYYTKTEEFDEQEPYTKYIYINLYFSYEFEDYTSIPGVRQKFTCDGVLSLMRELNTLIPDEDQQIQW